jgi:hypothetical protein
MKPMLAKAVAELPSGREWTYEVKWDGYRLISVKEGLLLPKAMRRAACSGCVQHCRGVMAMRGRGGGSISTFGCIARSRLPAFT